MRIVLFKEIVINIITLLMIMYPNNKMKYKNLKMKSLKTTILIIIIMNINNK